MIELPEAAVLASQISDTLTGRRVVRTTPASSPHKLTWYAGDPATYPSLLDGAMVDGAQHHGGMVEILLGTVRVVFSDGIQLRFIPPNGTLPTKHQLMLEFDDGSALCATVRMYGGICAFSEGTYDNEYYRAAITKPSPLGESFNREYFDGVYASVDPTKLSAKAFLATEQRIPGLGNGCLQDILFRAGVHPKRKIADLSDEQLTRLYETIPRVFREMWSSGGRETETDLFGNAGGYRLAMSRLTADTPCPVCGTQVVKASYMGGSVYFCPSCQPSP